MRDGDRVQIGEAIEAVRHGPTMELSCMRCGFSFGDGTTNYKLSANVERSPVTEIPGVGDPERYGLADVIEFRRFYCPGCGVQVATELARPHDQPRWDVQLDSQLSSDDR